MSPAKRKSASKPMGPKALTGSSQAKRSASVLLEALSGLVGPQEASERLGVALTRYYQLETRALQAMIEALEPRPRGRGASPERELERLRVDQKRLERELLRYQALSRASQRAVGLATRPSSKSDSKGEKKVRRRRRRARAETVVASLLESIERAPEEAGKASEGEEASE